MHQIAIGIPHSAQDNAHHQSSLIVLNSLISPVHAMQAAQELQCKLQEAAETEKRHLAHAESSAAQTAQAELDRRLQQQAAELAAQHQADLDNVSDRHAFALDGSCSHRHAA